MTAPPTVPRRLVYLGTPEAAVPPLRALVDAGHDVALVVSRADKRRRRNRDPEPSPVKAAALELGLPVSADLDDAVSVDADLGVVVAYGRLIPVDVLERLPMLNLHFSLLPRWRGAAPVERAILAGDDETGVCVMEVVEALDAGDVLARRSVPVGDARLTELRDRLVSVGSALLVECLDGPLPPAVPQAGTTTYAEKITPDDLRIDWTAAADQVLRQVRLERAWTTFRGARLLVVDAEAAGPSDLAPGVLDDLVVGAGDGGVRLVTVQPAGKGPMAAGDWANGAQPTTDDVLGQERT